MNLREGMQAFLAGVKGEPRESTRVEIYRTLLERFIDICEPMAEAAGDFEHASIIRTMEGRAIAITVPCARFHEMRKHCEVARYEIEREP